MEGSTVGQFAAVGCRAAIPSCRFLGFVLLLQQAQELAHRISRPSVSVSIQYSNEAGRLRLIFFKKETPSECDAQTCKSGASCDIYMRPNKKTKAVLRVADSGA